LVRHLGSDQPVYTLLQQGLDGVQMPDSRIEDMAAHGIAEVRRICPEGPYALGGGCIGGRVAFEMAQQLHAQGHEVSLLALFDTPAMRRFGLSPSALKGQNGFAKRANLHVEHLSQLNMQARFQYVLNKAKQRVTRSLWKIGYAWYRRQRRPLPHLLQDVMAINGQAVRRYVPQIYPGRITYFWARETPPDSSHGFREGWDKLAGGGFDFHEVPGDRDTMIREPHVQVLAEKLRVCLYEVHTENTAS
jgi:aspartate racemase